MHGEIFNLVALEKPDLKKALTDPLSYVSEIFESRDSGPVKAVGFKQFYNHLRMEYFRDNDKLNETANELNDKITKITSTVIPDLDTKALFERFDMTWKYLINDSSIKVIHLKRENKFETLVSLKTAFITDQWLTFRDQTSPKVSMDISREECLSFFEQIDFYEQSYVEIFRNHGILTVEYKRLAEDSDLVMKEVFDFLDVPDFAVKANLKKQILHPMNEIVTNYYELKAYFLNTKWSHYFDL